VATARNKSAQETRVEIDVFVALALRHVIPFSFARRPAVCGEPSDGAVLAQQPVTNGRHSSVDCVSVAADSGEVGRRDVGRAGIRRRGVELVPLLLQSHALNERQRRVHRSLTQTAAARVQ